MIQEINFDGLVGPTHNFAGLAYGNIASSAHSNQTSYPRKAALQGLGKMAFLMRMGVLQGVLPPHERPHIPTLRQLGFQQKPQVLIPHLAQHHPQLLAQMSSAAAMWVANAGTMSPSSDTDDGKAHFTPANLSSMLHRSIEHEQTKEIFRTIFADERYFKHHQALPGTVFFGDEGAANHTRLSDRNGLKGLHIFVYGQSAFQTLKPKKYPARQTLEASQAIARQHGLSLEHTHFIQQNPDVIDQGVFHNDVIAVGSRSILLCHEQAFLHQPEMLQKIKQQQEARTQESFYIIEAPTKQVSVEDAVKSYLFNTQIIFPSTNQAVIIAPLECQENPEVLAFLNEVIAQDNPITQVEFFDLRQSMHNGGGPACLRFQARLSEQELKSITTQTLLTEKLYASLKSWVIRHYREELTPADLHDPALYFESMTALDELTQILELGNKIYSFQRS